MNTIPDTTKTDTQFPDVPVPPEGDACARTAQPDQEKPPQEKPLDGFEDFDLDDIEVIESKVFA